MKSLRRWAIVALAGALLPLLAVERALTHAAAGQTYTVMLASDLTDGDLSGGVYGMGRCPGSCPSCCWDARRLRSGRWAARLHPGKCNDWRA